MSMSVISMSETFNHLIYLYKNANILKEKSVFCFDESIVQMFTSLRFAYGQNIA